MKKILLWLGLSILVISGCTEKKDEAKANDSDLTELTLVLDYVPNTNHAGIYLAQDKGYYKDAHLKVNIIEPGDDGTSLALVGAGKAQLGVSYQEDMTYAKADEQNKIPVKAIATILKHNTSGFVSLKDSGITRPKDFENKVYAGWQTPGEEAVLRAVMKNDGADFNQLNLVGSTGSGPQGLGKDADIQWYFEGWDVVKAKQAKIALNYMPVRDLDPRLDFYTPIFIGQEKFLSEQPQVVKAFLAATKKGYQDAIAQPAETAKLLHQVMPEYDLAFLEESQAFLSKNYTDKPEAWGVMEEKVWTNYTDFMFEQQLIKSRVPSDELFTNEFIE